MTVQQKQLNVLVIGDSCTDMYLMCRNTRLNPESSAPLVQVSSLYSKEGMAGNVAYGLKQLDIEVSTLVPKEQCIKRRYINAVTKEQLLRVDFDPKIDPLTKNALKTIQWDQYNAVTIADYDKGFLDYDVINLISDLFSGPVFLDTKKKNLQYFDRRILLKINEHEANVATKVPDNAIVTMGGAGVIWFNTRWPAYKSETVDVCGAGDAFMAGLVYGFLKDSCTMIDYAIVNAGLSVRHIGTYSPSLQELEQGLHEYYQQCRKD